MSSPRSSVRLVAGAIALALGTAGVTVVDLAQAPAAQAQAEALSYAGVTVKQGQRGVVAISGDTTGVKSFGLDKDQPITSQYPDGNLDNYVSVGTRDGLVTVAPARGAAATVPGNYEVPVKVTFQDGTSKTLWVPVTVTSADAVASNVEYPVVRLVQGGVAEEVKPTGDFPANTSFKLGSVDNVRLPGGQLGRFPGEINVAKSGAIRVATSTTAPVGDYLVPLLVTFPDGSVNDSEELYVAISLAAASQFGLEYPVVEVKQGGQVTIPISEQSGQTFPEGTKFYWAPAGEVTFPDGSVGDLGTSAQGADVIVVNANGSLTVHPPADILAGTYEVPIVAAYPDGSQSTLSATFTVIEVADNEEFDASFDAAVIKQGGSVVLDPQVSGAFGRAFPAEDVRWSIEGLKDKDGNEVADRSWLSVDPLTGKLTAKASFFHKLGEYTVSVKAQYLDGTADTVPATITVKGGFVETVGNEYLAIGAAVVPLLGVVASLLPRPEIPAAPAAPASEAPAAVPTSVIPAPAPASAAPASAAPASAAPASAAPVSSAAPARLANTGVGIQGLLGFAVVALMAGAAAALIGRKRA